jgi:CRISPR-associated exonuclease Cas4
LIAAVLLIPGLRPIEGLISWLILTAVVLAGLGLLLVVLAKRSRGEHGLGPGETIALDDRTLYSERLKLVGRPDRIERDGEYLIPEEWKPTAQRFYPGHRLQLGTYLILIEEVYGVRPPYGWVVIRDGERVRVENTEYLRSEVLTIAERIREHRRRLTEEIPVNQPAAKCRSCGQRENCGQLGARVGQLLAAAGVSQDAGPACLRLGELFGGSLGGLEGSRMLLSAIHSARRSGQCLSVSSFER